ncbi:MAG TPA: hypothetical protein ENJ34_03980, partial [Epsilonproteobacteria bacterium]|nr:hypothetical protein [Campylobacterota bacterium]
MKQLKIIFIFLLSINLLFGFATFSTAVNANSLAAKIQGKGITITNPRITRGRIGGGNSQVATFSNGISGANLSIDEGILLTASTANEAFSTNNSGRRSRNPGNINNIGGLPTYDPDLLGTILQTTIFNQVIFEFDVTLDDNTRLLLVDYQFASDEYPEWVGTQFNDAFGFFVSGGDLTQTYNIARVVDDSIIVTTANIASYKPVNVNNVNDGTLGNRTGTYGVFANDLTNSQFYIDNGGTDVGNGGVDTTKALIISEFDGFTTKLHATLDNLTPGQTYHFKMALADTSDASWDAGVFINKIIGVRVPSVCYDYDVRVGATVYPSNDNREINVTAFPGEQLNLGIAIQSEEGEISLEESNLSVILNPNNNFNFIDASISPDSINSYLPVPDAWVEKVPNAVIPTGENITAAGGTIQTNQVIFNNLNYELNSTTNNAYTNFDLNLSVTLNLNGILIRRSASTIDGSLTRCDGQNGYGPQWAYLNVEKRDSQLAVGNARYLLDTQISGKPFDIDIASYKITDPSDPEILENFTVELEMIDAGKYSNSEQSLFTCREPSSISTGVMVPFPLGNAQTRVPVNGFVTSNAIRNSAFRLWYLTDGNNTAINYTCAIYDDNTCYKPLYTANYASKSPLRCQTECTSGTGCYQCLKNFYAKPICSRDNFSVRPASYRLEIKDNNQSNDPTFLQTSAGLNNTLTPLKLAAGYKYILNGFATRYDTDTIANGYSQTFKDETDSNYISQFLFND